MHHVVMKELSCCISFGWIKSVFIPCCFRMSWDNVLSFFTSVHTLVLFPASYLCSCQSLLVSVTGSWNEMISLTSKWRVCIVRVTHWKFSWSQQEILKLLIRAQTIITKTRMVKMNCEMALCWIKKKSKFIPKLETNFEAYTSLTNKLKCFKL